MDVRSFARLFILAGAATAVGACSSVDPELVETGSEQYDYLRYRGGNAQWARQNGTIFGDENSLLGNLRGGGDENQLPVNKYLWRASLDSVSFLPIASIDTFSGVISTDWATPPDRPTERSRVTIFVRDADLTATALDVATFTERLGPGGSWQSVAVDPARADQLEDAILTRARQLRIEDVDG